MAVTVALSSSHLNFTPSNTNQRFQTKHIPREIREMTVTVYISGDQDLVRENDELIRLKYELTGQNHELMKEKGNFIRDELIGESEDLT
jgi:hypothetical protein